MNQELKITAFYFENNISENYKMLSFCDQELDPTNYLILQNAYEYDEQDISLDMNGVYTESSIEGLCGYKLILSFDVYEDRVLFHIDQSKLKNLSSVTLLIDQKKINCHEIEKKLSEIFR